jgi:hypothetical protein
MKIIILLFGFTNSIFAQTYGYPEPNQGPDHGVAKNFGASEWHGIIKVGSELTVNGQTYSYIRNSENNYKLARKEADRFTDVIPKLMTTFSSIIGMDGYSRLLHVYEDDKIVNIFSWGVTGYNFMFYQKREAQEPRLIRLGFIENLNHTYFAFDKSIQSIEFSGAAQMKITTIPTVEGEKRGYYDFKSPGVYEFRPDGVYLDGVFDPSVADREPQEVVEENIRKDPRHYTKIRDLHAARVASWTKEQMDAEAANAAKQPPQPNPKPELPETKATNIATAPSPPKSVTPAAVPVMTQNLISWLAGLVGLLVILLGYLGWRYFRNKARS